MDDKKLSTTNTSAPTDLPPTGDSPDTTQSNSDTVSPIDPQSNGAETKEENNAEIPSNAADPTLPPVPGDTPPLPSLSPEEVKTPTQPLPTPAPDPEMEKINNDLNNPITPPVLSEESSEEIVKTEKPLNMDESTPELDTLEQASQQNSDIGTPKDMPENGTASQDKKGDSVTPLIPPSPEQAETTKSEESVIAPEKKEMPVEAEFPGQPLPTEAQKNLEEKAKEMIEKDGGVKNRKVSVAGKPKGNVAKTLVGVLLMVLVGGGVFFGTRLTGNTTENRSQAGGTGGSSCPTKAECGGFTSCTGGLIYCTDPDTEQCNWVCDTHARINCCNGNWVITLREGEHGGDYDAACSDNGGHGSCGEEEPVEIERCTCESWGNNSCGEKCKFPPGTNGQADADSTCRPVIAMCNVSSGQVTYADLEDSGCKDEVDVCNNPVYYPNCGPDPKQCNESCSGEECGGGMVCDPTSNTCRNPSCTSSANCTCPDGDLVCNNLTSSKSSFVLGESYAFTCDAVATGEKSIARYQFRYQVNVDGWQSLFTSGLGVSEPLLISDPGGYVVQCRVCEDTEDNTLCTPYQVVDPD